MKISCVIPAYNEGSRISKVLDIVSSHQMIDEVVIIDDGSRDNTNQIIESYLSRFKKIKFIKHDVNTGKSSSICDGIKASSGDYLLFLDADLIGLNYENINDLILPITNNQASVGISLRRNSPRLWHLIGLDYISGERILPRSLIDQNLEEVLRLRPFGLEVFINKLIIDRKLRIKIVSWPNVDSPFKVNKSGLWLGIKGDCLMMLDIFKTISIWEIILQIIALKKLSV